MASNTKLPSLTRNALLNSMRTVSSLLFPLITFPYVSRILGAGNIGKINYSQSIVSYFALFAGLGITNYAIREGAKIKRDPESLTRFARQIFTINIISSVIAYVAFFITIAIIPSLHAYMVLLLIQCLTIGFTTLGVEWLYSIFEDYLYISVRTILVQVLSLVLMFAFVHTPSDYIIYAAISVFATSAANIWGFFYSRRYAKLALTRTPHIQRHFNPIMTLFMNNVATAVYSNAGTTFVGAMLGDVQVGLYSVAMKVYIIIRQAINSLTGVSMPRLSYLSSNDPKGYLRLLNKLFNAVIIVCIPAAIFVFALSRPIVLIISGPKYIEAVPMLEIIAFALAFTAPGVFLMNGILIPLRRGEEGRDFNGERGGGQYSDLCGGHPRFRRAGGMLEHCRGGMCRVRIGIVLFMGSSPATTVVGVDMAFRRGVCACFGVQCGIRAYSELQQCHCGLRSARHDICGGLCDSIAALA